MQRLCMYESSFKVYQQSFQVYTFQCHTYRMLDACHTGCCKITTMWNSDEFLHYKVNRTAQCSL